jgi:hypothetical protein
MSFLLRFSFLAQLIHSSGQPWPKCGDRTFDIIPKCFITARSRKKTNGGVSRICIAHTVILDCSFLRLQRPILNPVLLLEFLYRISFSLSALYVLSHFLATCFDNPRLLLAPILPKLQSCGLPGSSCPQDVGFSSRG